MNSYLKIMSVTALCGTVFILGAIVFGVDVPPNPDDSQKSQAAQAEAYCAVLNPMDPYDPVNADCW